MQEEQYKSQGGTLTIDWDSCRLDSIVNMSFLEFPLIAFERIVVFTRGSLLEWIIVSWLESG